MKRAVKKDFQRKEPSDTYTRMLKSDFLKTLMNYFTPSFVNVKIIK